MTCLARVPALCGGMLVWHAGIACGDMSVIELLPWLSVYVMGRPSYYPWAVLAELTAPWRGKCTTVDQSHWASVTKETATGSFQSVSIWEPDARKQQE